MVVVDIAEKDVALLVALRRDAPLAVTLSLLGGRCAM
jgi:hypothetical protein